MAAKKSKAEKDHEELVERRAELNRKWKGHPRAESHFTVPVQNASGEWKEKDLEVDAVDDKFVMNTHGEAYLTSDAAVRLMKHLQEAFQVVA